MLPLAQVELAIFIRYFVFLFLGFGTSFFNIPFLFSLPKITAHYVFCAAPLDSLHRLLKYTFVCLFSPVDFFFQWYKPLAFSNSKTYSGSLWNNAHLLSLFSSNIEDLCLPHNNCIGLSYSYYWA